MATRSLKSLTIPTSIQPFQHKPSKQWTNILPQHSLSQHYTVHITCDTVIKWNSDAIAITVDHVIVWGNLTCTYLSILVPQKCVVAWKHLAVKDCIGLRRPRLGNWPANLHWVREQNMSFLERMRVGTTRQGCYSNRSHLIQRQFLQQIFTESSIQTSSAAQ